MTTSTSPAFGLNMPGALGYPISTGFGCAIHTVEDLLFQKPSAAYEEAYKQIEEIIEEGEEEDPNKEGANTAPTPVPNSEQDPAETGATRVQNNTESIMSEPPQSTNELSVVAKEAEKSVRKPRSRRKFPEIVTEELQRALHDMGYCPQGFRWSRNVIGNFGRHVCEGGCHFVYDKDLNAFMDENGY
jgi:hypothetical protein